MTILDKLNYALNLNKTKRQQIITKALKSNDHKVIKKELTSKLKNTNSSRVKADIDFVNSYTKIVKGGANDNANDNANIKTANSFVSKDDKKSFIYYLSSFDANNIKNLILRILGTINSINDKKTFINSGINDVPLLICAVTMQDYELTKELLEHGANPNIQYYGYTPLMQASMSSNIEIIRLLLKYNANRRLKDKNGHNALELININKIGLSNENRMKLVNLLK